MSLTLVMWKVLASLGVKNCHFTSGYKFVSPFQKLGRYKYIQVVSGCNVGYGKSGTTCKLCDKGYYKSFVLSSACNKCPGDKTTASTGTIRSTDCSKPLHCYQLALARVFVGMVAGEFQ